MDLNGIKMRMAEARPAPESIEQLGEVRLCLICRKRILVPDQKTQQTERVHVGKTEVRRRGQAGTDVTDGLAAREFRELARNMVGRSRPTVVVSLQFPVTVDRLQNWIEGFSGHLKKRNHHFV